jgi:hypothetical protein
VSHLAAQRAVVRMLFDPEFARAARHDPDRVLAAVEPVLRRQLVALDERALRQDPLRRRRTLGLLADELKASTTLALAQTRSLAWLEGFFASSAFHLAVEERGVLVLAFAAWLAEELPAPPPFADVLAIETALARARRDRPAPPVPGTVRRAAGIFAVEVAAGATAAMQACERWLFEAALLKPAALCDDLPRPATSAGDRREWLVTVPTASGVTLVTVEREIYALLACLPGPRPLAAVVDEAARRGVDGARARALVDELCGDEILERA